MTGMACTACAVCGHPAADHHGPGTMCRAVTAGGLSCLCSHHVDPNSFQETPR